MNRVMDRPVVVVLAAGRGSRFEGSGHKLSQPLGGSAVLTQTLSAVVAAGLPVVVVTTAPLLPLAQRVVAKRDIVVLPSVGSISDEPLGMGYSISAGVSARSQAAGWLVLPGDMPLIRPDTLQAVASALDEHAVVQAQYRGRGGHPVGFGSELYSELAALSGDQGARRLLARYPALEVDLDDPGVLIDVDTQGDLIAARTLQAEAAFNPPLLLQHSAFVGLDSV